MWSREERDRIPPDVMQNAKERGTRVHRYADAIRKKLWIPNVLEEDRGYVESFAAWYEDAVVEAVSGEERFYCDEMRYTGQIDLVAKLKGRDHYCLVDYKTPA